MTTLRTTVIMKTDISASTLRFRALTEEDLHTLLIEHQGFLARHAAAHDGHIVKPEGDGFWLVFPSVTAAALAAMGMQEDLRLAQPNRVDDRLSMRIVVTLGDVMHEEGALVGDTVVLTVRIEAVTPPDMIYLSAAAWLALKHAEVATSYVDMFQLKGFTEPVAVYSVEQTHRTHVIENEFVVLTDLRGFSAMVRTSSLTVVEKVLNALFSLVNQAARDLGGTIRFNIGDSFCISFANASAALTAAQRISESWCHSLVPELQLCPINISVHQDTLYAFRSYFYGPALEVASQLLDASRGLLSAGEGGVFVTDEVRRRVAGSDWSAKLTLIDIASVPTMTPTYRLQCRA